MAAHGRAPFGATGMPGGWTGTEVVVVDPRQKRRAAAYYPSIDTWRTIARPPRKVAAGSPAYWTGTELVFVQPRGSGQRGLAAYDPITDKWRTTAPSPMNTIAASTWAAGVLVASSQSGLAAASYDPATDEWTDLPPVPPVEGPADGATRRVLSLHWTGDEVFALTAPSEEASPAEAEARPRAEASPAEAEASPAEAEARPKPPRPKPRPPKPKPR